MSFCNRINQEKKEKEKEKKMKTRLQRRIEEATHLRGGGGSMKSVRVEARSVGMATERETE